LHEKDLSNLEVYSHNKKKRVDENEKNENQNTVLHMNKSENYYLNQMLDGSAEANTIKKNQNEHDFAQKDKHQQQLFIYENLMKRNAAMMAAAAAVASYNNFNISQSTQLLN
jgi:hypothetical protein